MRTLGISAILYLLCLTIILSFGVLHLDREVNHLRKLQKIQTEINDKHTRAIENINCYLNGDC